MLITNHVLAGALVGAASPGPATAFGVGVVSHAAMDALPHWGHPDYSVFLKVAVVDGLVGLAALSYVASRSSPRHRMTVLAGMLGACLPDADKPGVLFVGRSPFPAAVDRVHQALQRESPRRMPQEVGLAAVGLLVVRALVPRRRP